MQQTFKQIKDKAKENLKGNWITAIAITVMVISLWILDIILQYILMTVFRVDAVWSVLSPTTLPHYSRVAGFCITAFSAAYGLFLFVPFFMGVLRWFWKNSLGEKNSLNTVFYYFSSTKLFFKTVYVAFLLFLLMVLGAAICFVPYVIMNQLTKPEFYNLFGCGMPLWTTGLFPLVQFFKFAGMVLFVFWVSRYVLFFVPFFEDEQMSVYKIIATSKAFTKDRVLRTVGFALSFVGWLILSVLLLPAFFILPYMFASAVEFARAEQEFDSVLSTSSGGF